MKEILKKLIKLEGHDILGNINSLQEKLVCPSAQLLKKQQLLLILAELSQNDIDILCGTDSLKKSNIIRRCIQNTGMNLVSCCKCFSDLLYALGCDEYLAKANWFRGTPVDVDNQKAMKIHEYNSAQEALDFAEKTDDHDRARAIYRVLADTGVPQAKMKVALECLESENKSDQDVKKSLDYLLEAANCGYEPACCCLGDLNMETADFEEAANWYGRAMGTGINESDRENLKFLNKVRRTNIKMVIFSVLAMIVGLVSMIFIIMLGKSSTASIVVSSIFELLSAAFTVIHLMYNIVCPYKNSALIMLMQNIFWVLAIIILI